MPEPGVGTDPWTVPDGGYFSSSTGTLDSLWNFATGVFDRAADYFGSEIMWDRQKWLIENGYVEGASPGGNGAGYTWSQGGGGSLNTVLMIGVGAVAVYLLVRAVK